MQIAYKGLKGLTIPPDLKEYAESRMEKFAARISENSFLELTFSDELGPKGGKDKLVEINADLVGDTIHVEALSNNYKGSIDLVLEKFEREVEKILDKKQSFE